LSGFARSVARASNDTTCVWLKKRPWTANIHSAIWTHRPSSVKTRFSWSRGTNIQCRPGHCLIIAKRHVERFLELSVDEKLRLMHWIDWSLRHLQESLSPEPDSFNVGLNDATAAGQTVSQFHVHIIPRHKGDVPDLRGIRWIIADKAKYWS